MEERKKVMFYFEAEFDLIILIYYVICFYVYLLSRELTISHVNFYLQRK
jgi:hypothetical protein